MKKIKFMIIILISPSVLFAQIDIKRADKIVADYLRKEIAGDYWLYRNTDIPLNEKGYTAISTRNSEISTNNTSFVYFIDEFPYANWAHPCRYLFVNKTNGNLEAIKAKLPPDYLEKWEMMTQLPLITDTAKFDFSNISVNLRSSTSAQNCYAVIISGGINIFSNYERYWNDCAAIYSALKTVYGYSDDHIYVIMADGTNPADDRLRINGTYDSSPLDLDGDGRNDIRYAATRSSIASVFNTLSSILTPNDNLFVFTTDHGDSNTILLWGETISSSEFATELNKVNAGNINVVMEQCYSGSFIPNLSSKGRTIATACAFNELSYAMPSLVYDEFVYHWISAIARRTPTGSPVNADSNADGYISMQEAFNYANSNDIRSESPQYYSNKTHLGNYLTLRGPQACLTTSLVNQSISTNTTITGCNFYLQDVTVTNGSRLTIDPIEAISFSGTLNIVSQLEIK